MNFADYILLGIIALALFLALRHIWKGQGRGCSGCCPGCEKACPRRKK